MADIISTKNIVKHLSKNHSYTFLVFETINSTNTFAKELAKEGTPHLTVVIADSQTDGRGRLGREFFSPCGTGIYMSIVIDPQKTNLPISLLTVAGGVAVCRAISSVIDERPMIKWVNDIFVNNKKVCGILAESVLKGDNPDSSSIILGIGINVSTPSDIFPGKLSEIAGSVFPKDTNRNIIIAKILTELNNILESSSTENLILEYKDNSLVLGKKISFTQNGKAYSGTSIDINLEGNLIVRLEDDSETILKSGEVSLGSANFSKNDI